MAFLLAVSIRAIPYKNNLEQRQDLLAVFAFVQVLPLLFVQIDAPLGKTE